jgi:hypothetical protein
MLQRKEEEDKGRKVLEGGKGEKREAGIENREKRRGREA